MIGWRGRLPLSPGIEEFYSVKMFIHEIRLGTIPQRARGAKLADRMRIEQKIITHRIWTLRFFGVDNSEDFYSL